MVVHCYSNLKNFINLVPRNSVTEIKTRPWIPEFWKALPVTLNINLLSFAAQI